MHMVCSQKFRDTKFTTKTVCRVVAFTITALIFVLPIGCVYYHCNHFRSKALVKKCTPLTSSWNTLPESQMMPAIDFSVGNTVA